MIIWLIFGYRDLTCWGISESWQPMFPSNVEVAGVQGLHLIHSLFWSPARRRLRFRCRWSLSCFLTFPVMSGFLWVKAPLRRTYNCPSRGLWDIVQRWKCFACFHVVLRKLMKTLIVNPGVPFTIDEELQYEK